MKLNYCAAWQRNASISMYMYNVYMYMFCDILDTLFSIDSHETYRFKDDLTGQKMCKKWYGTIE